MTTSPQAVWSELLAPGVPQIRLTSIETTQNDCPKPETSVEPDTNTREQEKHKEPEPNSADVGGILLPSTSTKSQVAHQARRFHLARNLSSVLGPNAAGGIRKPKSVIRPPLATFMERHGATFEHEENPLYRGKPVDKMLDVPNAAASENAKSGELQLPHLETLHDSKRNPTSTFVQARPKVIKNGTSINDHPSTWDFESDQLADELAALAMEFDPELQQKVAAERAAKPVPVPQDVVMTPYDREDEYIYETYVRVPCSDEAQPSGGAAELQSNYGILVIDEEDEDLWQKYVDSEDDTDWDEEDSNGGFQYHLLSSSILTTNS